MRRSTFPSLAMMLTLGVTLALPVGALARSLVPNSFSHLDASVSTAWHSGLLTAREKADVQAMQGKTERLIRDARRDGFVTAGERDRIRRQANATVATFRDYRDNRAVRFVSVAPAPRKHVHRSLHEHRSHPRRHVAVVIR